MMIHNGSIVALALSQINSFLAFPQEVDPASIYGLETNLVHTTRNQIFEYIRTKGSVKWAFKDRHPKPETGQGRYPIHHYNKRRFHKYGVFCVLGPAENWLAWWCESCFFRPASITAAAAWTTFKEEYYSSSISLYILSITKIYVGGHFICTQLVWQWKYKSTQDQK